MSLRPTIGTDTSPKLQKYKTWYFCWRFWNACRDSRSTRSLWIARSRGVVIKNVSQHSQTRRHHGAGVTGSWSWFDDFHQFGTPYQRILLKSCPFWEWCSQMLNKDGKKYFAIFVYQLLSLSLSGSVWTPHYVSRKCIYDIRTFDFPDFSLSKIIYHDFLKMLCIFIVISCHFTSICWMCIDNLMIWMKNTQKFKKSW